MRFPGNAPPRWAEAALRALVRPRDADIIAGDLLEEYRETAIPAKGAFSARVWYCRQVLSFLRSGGLTRLRSAALPDRFLWAAGVAIAEYAVLVFLPEKTGASAEVLVLFFMATLLVAGAASGIRSAGDAWIVCRVSAFWLLPLGIVAIPAVRAPVYTPVPLVAAFLVIVPVAGFELGRRTGTLRAGSAAGLVIGTVTFFLGGVAAAALGLPYPPAGAFPVGLAMAVILGTVGAMFGKRFGRGMSDDGFARLQGW